MPNTGLVSVIVLNHNKAAYSEACLLSLLHSTYSPVEVIAVDNGSADGTPDVLREFQEKAQQRGVHCEILTNDSNVGAIVGRNQAMERACGEYLVFVDNDVLVRDRDWLEKLRSALDSDPQVAIVSAKLLFPWAPHDLEFAGCAVTPNGRIRYLGRGEPGDAPEHNVQKEVQCVISACTMFRRGLVDEIGMLDEVFSPVQYEDLDFCYRARAAGYRVLYVPTAAMYHYEHTTTSGSVDINFKYVTIRNGMTFKKRWQHLFASESGPTDEEAKWRELPRQTIEQCPPPVPQ
jgi:GT2 family glycosyltransferase